jgi:hypothetical protein
VLINQRGPYFVVVHAPEHEKIVACSGGVLAVACSLAPSVIHCQVRERRWLVRISSVSPARLLRVSLLSLRSPIWERLACLSIRSDDRTLIHSGLFFTEPINQVRLFLLQSSIVIIFLYQLHKV